MLDGRDVEIAERNPADKGFVPQPKRWVVAQTYGIPVLRRCLVRECGGGWAGRLVRAGRW